MGYFIFILLTVGIALIWAKCHYFKKNRVHNHQNKKA